MAETVVRRARGLIVDAAAARAIRDGWKTVTRRIVRGGALGRRCPYGAPGDLLWVREPFQVVHQGAAAQRTRRPTQMDAAFVLPRERDAYWQVVYLADRSYLQVGPTRLRYRPPVHMPRWASRLALRVTEVAPERLNLITDAGARLEGYVGWPASSPHDAADTARDAFAKSWDRRYRHARADQWSANPWVWVIRFVRTDGRLD